MAESDTWEEKENLENTKEAVEEYKKEYRQDMEDIRRQERKEGTFRRGNCQNNLQQKSYLNSQTNDMMRNIGENWKEIGNNRKKDK